MFGSSNRPSAWHSNMALVQTLRMDRMGRYSERDLPAVFTPPRDDPATRPRFWRSPRELDEKGMDNPTRVATRQACFITVMALIAFALIAASVCGMFNLATAIMGRNVVFDCKDQPIQNGIIRSGPINGSAMIHCDKGYVLKQTPDVQLKCELVWQHCITYKRATELTEAIVECKKKFGYVPSTEAGDVMLEEAATQKEVNDHTARLELATYELTRGACVLGSMIRAQQLYGDRHHRVPKPSARGPASLGWSPSSSSLSLFLLAFISLGAVIASGVAKARQGGSTRRMSIEPDTAALLDDSDEANSLPDVEDDQRRP